jgi:hypothetical protein
MPFPELPSRERMDRQCDFITSVGAFIADRMRQLIDIQPCLSKHGNMTLVVIRGLESRSGTRHDWKILLRNSANNMLTRPPYDVPRANFADNPDGFGAATCSRLTDSSRRILRDLSPTAQSARRWLTL